MTPAYESALAFLYNHALLTHILLLGGDVLATVVVAWGILWEAPSQPEYRHRIAAWLVIGGVAAETLCSIALFAFDESISHSQQGTIASQQDKIIALEKELSWRDVAPAQTAALRKSLMGKSIEVELNPTKFDPEAFTYAWRLALALGKTDAKVGLSFPRDAQQMGLFVMQSSDPATKVIERALCAAGIEFGVGAAENDGPNRVTLYVGPKPHGNWPRANCRFVLD